MGEEQSRFRLEGEEGEQVLGAPEVLWEVPRVASVWPRPPWPLGRLCPALGPLSVCPTWTPTQCGSKTHVTPPCGVSRAAQGGRPQPRSQACGARPPSGPGG